MMGHSDRCNDLKTHWDASQGRCVLCDFARGREVTPNCGIDDRGGRHEGPTSPCKPGTFNDGSWAYCRTCTSCPSESDTVKPCSLTTDTQCRVSRNPTTDAPVREKTTRPNVSASTIQTNQGSNFNKTTEPRDSLQDSASSDTLWVVPLGILISIVLAALVACVYIKRKRGQHTVLSYNRRSSYINAGFSSLSASPGNNDLEDLLSPAILSAPLQTVLDNLDVLEELVILLDPESHGVKNTKHLASHCSFPSTWITYTYSMRDSKSPLKAVLEGVTSRHPEWTVGHLVKLLRQIERNDAVAVLAKLRLNEMDV